MLFIISYLLTKFTKMTGGCMIVLLAPLEDKSDQSADIYSSETFIKIVKKAGIYIFFKS